MAEEKKEVVLTLSERILRGMMSGSTRKQLLREYCTPKMVNIFTDREMMSTVESFFSCSMNVSQTAEKLFMHRNTLTYRIKKIQQDSGLDIRIFDDACAFKILYALFKFVRR